MRALSSYLSSTLQYTAYCSDLAPIAMARKTMN